MGPLETQVRGMTIDPGTIAVAAAVDACCNSHESGARQAAAVAEATKKQVSELTVALKQSEAAHEVAIARMGEMEKNFARAMQMLQDRAGPEKPAAAPPPTEAK